MRRTVKHALKRLLAPRTSGGKGKPEPAMKKRVWRISDTRPGGEWVDANAPSPAPESPPETSPADLHSSGWLTSAMDLLSGAEIVEFPDTVPPDDADRT